MTLRPLLLTIVAVIALGLGGCFTSKTALIGPEKAVFPFEKIVFGDADKPDDRQTWTRKGDAYSFRPDDNLTREALVRLAPVGENLYLFQMEVDDDGVKRLYAVLKVDLAARTATSYAAILPDNSVKVPGVVPCDNVGCIEDLDAYLAWAKESIAAGAEPAAVYRIISTE